MHLKFRNVNDSFAFCVNGFETGDIPTEKQETRNGRAYVVSEPMLLTYTHPRERVLFNTARDCNPFFHLYEALWMLAGRNDVAPLAFYNSNIVNYSDDGKTFNGGYGHRWRNANRDKRPLVPDIDQLALLIEHLKHNPESRRAVLQMWNVEDDLLKIGGGECPQCAGFGRIRVSAEGEYGQNLRYGDNFAPCPLCAGSRDVCCNLSVMFSLRDDREPNEFQRRALEEGAIVTAAMAQWNRPKLLDMTVTNRSNDMIWGLFGSNYVCFSILQEYMACMLGAEVGVYNHFTNNLHAYLDKWEAEKWLDVNRDEEPYPPSAQFVASPRLVEKGYEDTWDELNQTLVETYAGSLPDSFTREGGWGEPFFDRVAAPVFRVFRLYKQDDLRAALQECDNIGADDWRIVCSDWILRRVQRRALYAPKEKP